MYRFYIVSAVIISLILFNGGVTTLFAALRFLKSEPRHFDFADQAMLPPSFGSGEFSFEIWIRPDASFPVGRTNRGTISQLENWAEADRRPYNDPDWWTAGNFLLDGHSRPDGFNPENTREGTFSLQFYGGGRLRWMFADDGEVVPVGKVWTAQAFPAASSPSLPRREVASCHLHPEMGKGD